MILRQVGEWWIINQILPLGKIQSFPLKKFVIQLFLFVVKSASIL